MSEAKAMEITNLEEINISEEELPSAVAEKFSDIVEIDRVIQECATKQASANESVSRLILAKSLNQKEAINSTQDAVRALSDAQASLSGAQLMLFENQQKMADGMRYLLMLGASSIAMSKLVISELESKLKQAETEKLSQSTKEELIKVIKLLKDQESTITKQERMSEKIAETSKAVASHEREIESIHRVDAEQSAKDERHDELIAKNALVNEAQESELKRQQSIDKEHEAELKKIKKLAITGIAVALAALVCAVVAIFL